MALLPDVSMGWSATASGSMPETLTGNVADQVSDKMLQLWLDVARDEAAATYGGRYVASGGLNSSLTIRTDADKPGIGLYDWLSNGTDFNFWAVTFGWGEVSEKKRKELVLSARLYPTGLEETTADGGRKEVFRAIFEDLSGGKVVNSYVTDCSSWIYTNAIYGSRPLDLFVFNFNKEGKVVSVENEALRVTLNKVS
jgi:hypothetical protein